MNYQTVNPYNGKAGKTFERMTDAQLDAAIETAANSFEKWKRTSFAERGAILTKAASLMRKRIDELAGLVTQEMGKLISESKIEVNLTAGVLEYYAKNAERFLVPEPLEPLDGEARIENTPLGVLLGIQVWNLPYHLLARFAAPNLMAGNVVMVKHAEAVPQCALAFEEVWRDAGAPAGAYTNCFISHDQVSRLIEDPRIKGVALTGGLEAGKAVAEQAGRNLKKSTMELSANDAFIVLKDADLDKAVEAAVWSKMTLVGQSCIAAKRYIVVDELAEPFMKKFKAALSVLKPGDPMNETTTLGPLASERAVINLVKQVDQAVAHGAKVVLGGKRVDRAGAFMEPTIISDIKPGNPAYREEFFGPVALMFIVKNEDEAVALANDSDYGLGASIFTGDVARAERLASRLNVGMVFINQPTWTAPELPFGGINDSGYGRNLSNLGIQEFVNKKVVRVASIDEPA